MDEFLTGAGFINEHKIRVLWTDSDPAGINFYGNYFKWMDEASYYLFRAGGILWEEWRSRFNALGIPLVSAHADFKSPNAFGDELTVKSAITEWGRSSFRISHIFMNGDVVSANGYEKRVFCLGNPEDPSTFKSAPIPEAVRAALGG
ncbi:MAG: thioesterase family protein [Rhodospirillaceae bacterium]|jgi:4-hydroxybenzoyl-CoA thioesterase